MDTIEEINTKQSDKIIEKAQIYKVEFIVGSKNYIYIGLDTKCDPNYFGSSLVIYHYHKVFGNSLFQKEILEELSNISLPNKFGEFQLRLFEDKIHGDHHIALVKGEISENDHVLVRVHSQCLTGDIFASLRCDCGPQLVSALDKISQSIMVRIFIFAFNQ